MFRQESICKLASSQTFSFSFVRITTSDLSALAYVMSTTAACHMEATPTATPTLPTTKLRLSGCRLDDEQLTALVMELNNEALCHLEDLYIDGGELTSAGLEALAKRLQHSKLKTLELLHVRFDLDQMKALFHEPKFPTDLIHVRLSDNRIRCDSVEVLARGLSCTYIKQLNISNNEIGDDGAKVLASGLALNTELLELNLSYNGIGDDGAKALLDALQNNTTLLELNLTSNTMGRDSGEVFAIGQHNTTGKRTDHSRCKEVVSIARPKGLKKLILNYNIINLDCATALSDYLLNNYKHLVHLDLSINVIGSDGVVEVCLKLLHHPELKNINMSRAGNGRPNLFVQLKEFSVQLKEFSVILDLSYTGISTADAAALAHGIKEMQELKCPILHRKLDLSQDSDCRSHNSDAGIYLGIDLSGNHIDTHGAKVLLDALRPCDNIQVVDLRFNYIAHDPDTLTDLKAAFRHPIIDRKILLSQSSLTVISETSANRYQSAALQ